MPEFESVTLRDPSSSLTATYFPNAGMIGTSLADDGVELLGQRRGLQAYVSTHRTMGIPILYPWANRLSSNGYGVDGAVVTLTPGTGGVRTDQHGVPIHGTLAGFPDWHVTTALESQRPPNYFAARPGLLATFPFPHLLELDITLEDRTCREDHGDGDDGRARPVVLRLSSVPAAARCAAGAVADRNSGHAIRPVNARGIPTGAMEEHKATTETLGDKFFDDGYDDAAGAVFAVSGGDRRIEVHFDEGYTAAQVFAPGDDDVVCFEPMAAPTDSLRRGGYRVVHPGESAVAQFRIKVRAQG